MANPFDTDLQDIDPAWLTVLHGEPQDESFASDTRLADFHELTPVNIRSALTPGAPLVHYRSIALHLHAQSAYRDRLRIIPTSVQGPTAMARVEQWDRTMWTPVSDYHGLLDAAAELNALSSLLNHWQAWVRDDYGLNE